MIFLVKYIFIWNKIVLPYFEHSSANISRFQQKSVIWNHTITLLCPAIGLPKPKLVWFYNGQEIQSNRQHILIKHNGKKLIITKIKVKEDFSFSKFFFEFDFSLKMKVDMFVRQPMLLDRLILHMMLMLWVRK